jgi:hypothetical protein
MIMGRRAGKAKHSVYGDFWWEKNKPLAKFIPYNSRAFFV